MRGQVEGVDEVLLEGGRDALGVLLPQRLQVAHRLVDVLGGQGLREFRVTQDI